MYRIREGNRGHTRESTLCPLTQSASKTIRVQGGQVGFYEYSFVSGPLANVFFLGAEIEPLADLKSLKAARM